MEHTRARIHLDDLRKGELNPSLAAEVRAHVEQCEECRATLGAMEHIAGAVALHGEALFDEHPEAEELAGLAEGGVALSLSRLAQIRAHLHVCATCRQELESARAVHEGDRSRVRLLRTAGARPIMRWAIAACITLVLALLGRQFLTRATEDLHGENRVLTTRLEEAEAARALAEASANALLEWSGSLSSLVVPAPFRGLPSGIDTVLLREGQPLLPILVDFDSSGSLEGTEGLAARILSAETGSTVWHAEGRPEDWRDASLGTLSLSLPLRALPGGTYRFELVSQSDHRLLRRLDFVLVSALGAPEP